MMIIRLKLSELLKQCSKDLLLNTGKEVHGVVTRKCYGFQLVISNDLINMYGKCGRVDLASNMFEKMLERNVVSWTALMSGFLLQGDTKKPLLLLREMGLSSVKPNEYTFSTCFKACGELLHLENGMQIHGLSSKSGYEFYHVVGNSIVDMYSRCGRISDAVCMFHVMPDKSLISWNVMIAGYALEGEGQKSMLLFKKMQQQGEKPDGFTITSTLKSCAGSKSLLEAIQLHALMIVRGFPFLHQKIILGALIDLYVNCGCLLEAHKVFDKAAEKSVISWLSLITGYAEEGKLAVAMKLFQELRKSTTPVDGFVVSGIIAVFADFALLELGKQLHSYSTKIPLSLDISVANSIVDMYLKCGLVDEAERYFHDMPEKNVVSWTIMITGYGKHGMGIKAVDFFNEMLSNNIEPDGVAYFAVLLACSHSGLIVQGQEYFTRLCYKSRIKPRVEHYACMVDILGRAGRLEEAKNLIQNMALKPNIGIWQTLLSACKVHKDVKMGRKVGEILLKMDSNNPVNFVMMSNIYAGALNWEECERLRGLVESKGLTKTAGRSWVEINKEIHFFYNGDELHPLTLRIHGVLKEMEKRLKEEIGYVKAISFSMYDVDEETKEESLRVHSEKLAIGLALVCGGLENDRVPIRVFKNLRICGDCHDFFKGLSKVVSYKVFLVRDSSRFHKFENGVCSCGDYW